MRSVRYAILLWSLISAFADACVIIQPFLAQAEQEKLDYESARKMYEDGTTGYGNNINFSILPGSTINLMPIPRASAQRSVKQELSSESESDGFNTDDGADNTLRSSRRR